MSEYMVIILIVGFLLYVFDEITFRHDMKEKYGYIPELKKIKNKKNKDGDKPRKYNNQLKPLLDPILIEKYHKSQENKEEKNQCKINKRVCDFDKSDLISMSVEELNNISQK